EQVGGRLAPEIMHDERVARGKQLSGHGIADVADANEPDPHWSAPRLQGVKPENVVPEDLLLAGVAERQRQESVHRAWVLGVAMRVIGRGHEIVVADELDDVPDQPLVALHRAEALTSEVL